MEGYGYSLWLVPVNWKEIKETYNMLHIPHITICTNMEKIDCNVLSRNLFRVHSFSNMTQFPKMYANDPLDGVGFYCAIDNIATNHKPHMTLRYNEQIHTIYIPPEFLTCSVHIADTRSLNCEEWTLIK